VIHNDLGMGMFSDPNYSKIIYFKPWARIGAYQIGVIGGMLYYEYVKGDKDEGDKTKLGYRIYKIVNVSTVARWI